MAIKVVFMGSSDFSGRVLKCLADVYVISGVITQPDKPAGRGKVLTPPPAKEAAETLNIPVFQPVKLRTPEAFAQLAKWQPDLIVVAAYGQILRQNVLELPKYGCINVHASYLPRWRGAAPIQAAILNGDVYTGATIMKMDAGIDTGPELAKCKVEIASEDDYYSLSNKLAETGGKLLVSTLKEYLDGRLTPVPQDDIGATYAAMIKKEDGLLDFNQPAVQLERKIRAYIDWPGSYFVWEGQNLKVRKVKIGYPSKPQPGLHMVLEGYPAVGTLEGALILLEVQPAGKRWMSGADFLHGIKNWITN